MKKFNKTIVEKYYEKMTEDQRKRAFCEMVKHLYVGDEISHYDDNEGLRVYWSHTGENLGD
jgi:hypothetical protein